MATSLNVCPICETQPSHVNYRFRDPDHAFAEPLPVVSCKVCGLAYVAMAVNTDKLYSGFYYGKGKGSWLFEPFNRFWVLKKARLFAQQMPGRRLLDFGCGRGDFLLAMRELGYDVWGLETQPDSLARLQTLLGDHMASGLDELASKDVRFQSISMWHVLEHVANPKTVLKRLTDLATPDARLFIAVPNWPSLESQVFGDRSFHLDVPRHLLHFSEPTLRRLLADMGWRVERVSYSAWAYNLFGLWQTLLNIGPGPRNLFYIVAKRGYRLSRVQDWLGALWTLAAAVPMAILAVAMIVPLTGLKRTGTFEVVAQRL